MAIYRQYQVWAKPVLVPAVVTLGWLSPLSAPVQVKQVPTAVQQADIKTVTPWCTSNEQWNSADKSATITLSDNGLTATKASSDGNYANARGTISRSAGKVYFECLGAHFTADDEIGIGIANASQPLDGVGNTNWIGDASKNGFGLYYHAASGATNLYINGVATVFPFASGAGDNIGFAIDFNSKLVWVRVNGGSWLGSGGLAGDPVAGTNGLSWAALNSGPYFPATSLFAVGESATVQTYTPYTYAPPSGYGNWQDAEPNVYNWYAGLSEPVQIEPGLAAAWTQYHSGITVTAAAVPAYFFNWLSGPVRTKQAVAYQQPFTIDAKWQFTPTVTAYNWFAPLSEPAVVEPGLSAAWMQVSSIGTSATFVFNFHIQLSEPVRIKRSVPWQQPFATDLKPPIFADLRSAWYQRLAEPVRTKKSVPFQQPFTIDWKWSSPVYLSWNQWLTEPVRSKQAVAWQQTFTTDWKAPVVTFYNWSSSLAEPIRTKPVVAYQQPFTMDRWTAPIPLASMWHQLLSGPVRAKPSVPFQQPFTIDWKPTAVTVNYWFYGFSEPRRTKAAIPYQQPFAMDRWTAPIPLVSMWHNWLAEPVRYKLSVPYQQPFTTDWNWTAPPIFTDLRNFWFAWLSEPVRTKKSAPWQQPYSSDWKWVSPAYLSWHEWFSEPVRFKKPVPWQQSFAMDRWTAPTPLVSMWHEWLSEPVRFKKSVPWQQPFTMDWRWRAPDVALTNFWFEWLSEPVRPKLGLRAALQQTFTTDYQWTAPIVRVSAWFQWLTEPQRSKPPLQTANRQAFTTDWKWTAPPILNINYSFDVTEIGDRSVLTYRAGDIVYGANVTMTEIDSFNLARVTITEIEE